jgi:hypothetical protein
MRQARGVFGNFAGGAGGLFGCFTCDAGRLPGGLT